MRAAIALFTGLLGLCLIPEGVATEGADDPDWDMAGAARYLDARMDLWFERAKTLETDRGTTLCLSCHTGVPYAMARPALRRAMKVAAPTAQELRLREIVGKRVETYDTHELFYEFNEAKRRESRGTEAVLNAVVLAGADADRRRTERSALTERAFERLWHLQRSDGAWDWLDFGLEPWEGADSVYFGATLAALAIGTAPSPGSGPDPAEPAAVERLRGFLKAGFGAQHLFNRIWALLAATRTTGWVADADREALVREIATRQRHDGGWSLESLGPWRWSRTAAPFAGPGAVDETLLEASDGYATGLIVHALRDAGVRGDHPALARGLAWLAAAQRPVDVGGVKPRAWRAHSLNFDREHGGDKGEPFRQLFMSDAATAFAVLGLVGSH